MILVVLLVEVVRPRARAQGLRALKHKGPRLRGGLCSGAMLRLLQALAVGEKALVLEFQVEVRVSSPSPTVVNMRHHHAKAHRLILRTRPIAISLSSKIVGADQFQINLAGWGRGMPANVVISVLSKVTAPRPVSSAPAIDAFNSVSSNACNSPGGAAPRPQLAASSVISTVSFALPLVSMIRWPDHAAGCRRVEHRPDIFGNGQINQTWV